MRPHPVSTAGADPSGPSPLPTVREELAPAARRLARISLLGVLVGALVGGVLSRLAMLLLARLNDAATGRVSDDGFVMGRFTLSGSANLLLTGAALGLLGAGFYFALRGLMVGPRWFRLLSISLGPAVVLGSQLVHTDGVDFTLLQPAWLAIAVFVALPGVYAALLSVLAEAVIARDDRWTSRWWTVAGLLVWLPLAPVLAVLVAGRLALVGAHRVPSLRALVGSSVVAWVARGALTVLFVVALILLVDETRILI
ncbi:MAG: hypothetical protein JWO11_2297 [Nocardioides sp.]|nr:hypothetical protein [Nocardioides sp.]